MIGVDPRERPGLDRMGLAVDEKRWVPGQDVEDLLLIAASLIVLRNLLARWDLYDIDPK